MRHPIAVFAAVLALAGCGGTPLTSTTEVSADHGVVVLRLATNMSPAGFFATYESVQLTSDGGTYSLSRRGPGVVRTGVFTGTLPAGRYRLTRFETINTNILMTSRRWVDVPGAFGSFTVQPGQLTDLGTFIYSPAGGNKVLFARAPSETETRELVAAAFPKVASAVLSRQIRGWDESPHQPHIARIFEQIRARVAPVNNPSIAPSGAVYAGSALGQVLVRSARTAQWSQLDTGTTREILAVLEDGAAIVAGGEEGFLARSVDGGASWQRMPSPDGGAILHLTRRPGAGLLAVSLLDRTLTVWERVGETWRMHDQFPFERSFNIGAQPPCIVSGARSLYVGMPNGTIHALDFANGQWRRHEAPFSLVALATAGEALYAYGARFAQSIWVSEDAGATWRDLETSRRAGAPVFSDARTGYLLYAGTEKISVQVTKDAGRTWTDSGALPDAAMRRVSVTAPMIVHPSGQMLLLFGNNGAVYSTRDLGATWVQERRGAF